MPENKYIAQMKDLKASDPEIWEFFKQGNFSVSKSRYAFSAIGADHGIEQFNKDLKLLVELKDYSKFKYA